MSCSSAAGIANISDESQLTGRIIRSFLADTADWQSIGTVPSRNPYLSSYSGAFFGVLDPNGDPYSDVSSAWFGSQSSPLNRGPSSYLFSEFLPAKSDSFVASLRGSSYSMSYALPAGGFPAVRMKFGPTFYAVQPSAGPVEYLQSGSSATQVLSIAPGSLISIYGYDLALSTAQATSTALPTTLAGTTVTANGRPIPILFASPQQINAYLPQDLLGATKLQVTNSHGQDSASLCLVPAAPAAFSLDGSGSGAAAALHALSGQPVTSGNPAAAGEYISLFVTGLGVTYQSGGVSYASAPVFVVMAGGTVPASFAGSAPGFVGLYQVNFQVPSAAQHGPNTLVVASGRYFSSPQISIAVR